MFCLRLLVTEVVSKVIVHVVNIADVVYIVLTHVVDDDFIVKAIEVSYLLLVLFMLC